MTDTTKRDACREAFEQHMLSAGVAWDNSLDADNGQYIDDETRVNYGCWKAAWSARVLVAAPPGWKLVPLEPTAEIIAAATIAVWPAASSQDIALAREAAKQVLMSMRMSAGVTADMVAASIATMGPAYRAMVAAAPETPVMSTSNDKRDADRYRWLRDVSVPPHNFYISVPDEFKDVKYRKADVDAAIDAAIVARASTGDKA